MLKIAVIGTRGFPNVQGGVEKHCENLYPLLAGKGCEVTVFAREPYVTAFLSSPPLTTIESSSEVKDGTAPELPLKKPKASFFKSSAAVLANPLKINRKASADIPLNFNCESSPNDSVGDPKSKIKYINGSGFPIKTFGNDTFEKEEVRSKEGYYLYKGVKIVSVPCPKSKSFEAIVHSFRALFAAYKLERGTVPETGDSPSFVLHIHAIGPALITPFARLLGFKVVFTHHGPDYKRAKWGFFAKLMLRLGEAMGVIFSNQIVAISEHIADEIKRTYGKNATVIPNGVNIPLDRHREAAESGRGDLSSDLPAGKAGIASPPKNVADRNDGCTELNRLGVQPGKYVLAIGRLVPEKGFHDLIEAISVIPERFNRESKNVDPRQNHSGMTKGREGSRDSNFKLIIVGDADHETDYSRNLKKKAAENPNVILTGFKTGKDLEELYSHAGLFVLPSYYEGLPIVLLEAMSYGLSCVVTNIPANRNVKLSDNRYFKPGDTDILSQKLDQFIHQPISAEEKEAQIAYLRAHFDWSRIAAETLKVYQSI